MANQVELAAFRVFFKLTSAEKLEVVTVERDAA